MYTKFSNYTQTDKNLEVRGVEEVEIYRGNAQKKTTYALSE
jgi:hypothetical protein